MFMRIYKALFLSPLVDRRICLGIPQASRRAVCATVNCTKLSFSAISFLIITKFPGKKIDGAELMQLPAQSIGDGLEIGEGADEDQTTHV